MKNLSDIFQKVIFLLCIIVAMPGYAEKPKADKTGDKYLEVVKKYADVMLANGRDRYGKEASPLFASALDMSTLSLPEGAELKKIADLDPKTWGIRKNDRTLSGANVMHQENLYQVLYALTDITGEDRYAREADKSLEWFFENCQSPVTGLMVWGEHMGWDFQTDTVAKHFNVIQHSVGEGMTHEFYRPWVLWERSFDLHPDACYKFAMGLWNHQIYDQVTGNFSRHAKWDRHNPGKSSQYPRHAGFYIATWAKAYSLTGDPAFPKAIETLMNFYGRYKSEKTGVIPVEIDNPRTPENNLLWPQHLVSFSIDLWDASFYMQEPLRTKMKNFAAQMDAAYNKMKHRLEPGGEGFITQSETNTLEAVDIRNIGKRVYSDLWASGYGDPTDAGIGSLCYMRYRQEKHPGYAGLVVAAADRYLDSEPEIEFPIYPGTFGDVIYLLLGAKEITGNEKYLGRASYFADKAIDMFLRTGTGLPSASSRHDHYEAITREDTLMMALLKLHLLKTNKQIGTPLLWCDR